MKPAGSPNGKRARTRTKLIDAALSLLEETSLASVSLEGIAARAGMTKGAFYSNFAGRAELLLALAEARGLTLRPTKPAQMGVAGLLTAYATSLIEAVARAQPQAEFIADLQAEAVHDQELRAGLAKLHREGFRAAADELCNLGMATAEADRLAAALQAVALGLLLQSLITPEEISPDLIRAVIASLPR